MNWREWCGDAIIVPVNAGIIGERHSNLKEDQKIMKRRKIKNEKIIINKYVMFLYVNAGLYNF